MDGTRRGPVVVIGTLAIGIGLLAAHARAQDDRVDFSDRVTATCEIVDLVARPPAGWFNVPFDTPPKGHLGCQMMRTDEREALVGILRIRSAAPPAREFTGDGYDGLLANEITAVGQMGFVLADEPLWTRDRVPIAGLDARDGRSVGLLARIEGNDVAQEAHFLVFRTDRAKYAVTLLTPARAYDGGALWQRNTDDFGVLIRTLKRRR